MADSLTTFTKKDLKSDQEVRWCPGCGDYAILNCVQGVLADIGVAKENLMMVSGIGCSSRFPYYMNTYGFHSIHGRAPAIATGVKVANPELSVWIVTGDGDAMSIGNHLIHALRRNLDVNILLFNNEIYGLTKGQYSPTSKLGLRTKTSPQGSVDNPFDTLRLALGAGATFVGRTIDSDQKHMAEVLRASAEHKGTSFIEIYQNCVIFNDGVFDEVAAKKVRAEQTVDLRPGEPIVYGADHDKGLAIDGFNVKKVAANDAAVWNAGTETIAPAVLMSEIDRGGDMPTPVGIFRTVDAPVYTEEIIKQQESVLADKGPGRLEDLIYAGDTWTVD